jgi:hypothetical protein
MKSTAPSLPVALAAARRREVELYGSPLARLITRQVRETARR